MICACYGLFEILKNYICLSFDENEFDFVTYVFYNKINCHTETSWWPLIFYDRNNKYLSFFGWI
jgi:hypothetical protein